ncbi:MAG: hypothetical protein HUJ68_06600 [Clostridia bacterium]|nr:hypothetical protein [Clostridia bacterium]
MKDKGIKTKEIIINHIVSNKKEYIIVMTLFIIGIFLGVIFINNIVDNQKVEIQNYLNDFVNKIKNQENVNSGRLIKTSIISNITFAITIWFLGTTVIRITDSIWNSNL